MKREAPSVAPDQARGDTSPAGGGGKSRSLSQRFLPPRAGEVARRAEGGQSATQGALSSGAKSIERARLAGKPGDFAFLNGKWTVDNRRLKERGVGADDWEMFVGLHEAQTLLGGIVSVDRIYFPTKGFAGSTFRTLERSSGLWSLHWVNSAKGVLDPPVVGGFDDGHGLFEGDDKDGDRPVKVRFYWNRSPDAPSWRQDFSYDGGKTWETNWTMDFSRA